ncbi:MAG: type II toxin-antitoxin system PemK/MazF family toxin [Acidobacteriota bacterium]|nr:type II toxin-antitoxin system PemK/MazF family toxin [Acidobacteriota bacterium]
MPSKKAANPRSAPRAPQASDQWEVVIVPFPFSTQPGNKRRPALVLSKRSFNQHGSTVLAMITTAGHHPWPGDVMLTDLKSAGLNAPCLMRLKLFTLDNRLIVKKIGRLAATDQQRVSGQLQTYLPW